MVASTSSPRGPEITADTILEKMNRGERLVVDDRQIQQVRALVSGNRLIQSALATGQPLQVEAASFHLAEDLRHQNPLAGIPGVQVFGPVNAERVRPEVVSAAERAEALNKETELRAQQLVEKSSYDRTPGPNGTFNLEHRETHKKFTMVPLTDPTVDKAKHGTESGYHPDLEAFSQVMRSTFTEAECDPMSQTAEFVASNFEQAKFRDGEYLGMVIKTAEGKPIGMVNCDYIPSTNLKTGKLNGYGHVAIGYIITDPNYRGGRMSNELYRVALEFGMNAAAKRGQILAGMVGESVPMLESRANTALAAIARSRLYVKTSDGTYVESRYVQPNLDPQPEDGPNAGQSAEHLMYGPIAQQFIEERKMPADIAIEAVFGMYQRFAKFRREKPDGMDQRTYERNKRETEALFQQFKDDLLQNSSDGQVYLLTRAMRKQAIANGVQFIEHVDADHLDAVFLGDEEEDGSRTGGLKELKRSGSAAEYEEAMHYLLVDVNPNPADLAAAIAEYAPELEADINMYKARFAAEMAGIRQ